MVNVRTTSATPLPTEQIMKTISSFLQAVLFVSLVVLGGACSDDSSIVNPDGKSAIASSAAGDGILGKKGGPDKDKDGILNGDDNCPNVTNPDQEDAVRPPNAVAEAVPV